MRLEVIALKSILIRKKRVLFLIATLVVAVGLVNSMYQLNLTMDKELGETFDKLGPNIMITPRNGTVSLAYGGMSLPVEQEQETPLIADDYMKVYQIHDRDSVAVVSPKLLETGDVDILDQEIMLMGVYFQFEEKLRPWWQWEGELPFQDTEIMLGYELAKQNNLTVGDLMRIEGKEFSVTAVLDKQGSDEDQVVFMTLLTLQSLKERGEQISFIEVAALCTTCPLPEITQQIKAVLPHTDVKPLQETVEMRKHTVERIQEFMLLGSIVITVIGCIVIGISMMNYVFDRNTEIGVMRAVGLRRKHVMEILMSEVLVIAVIGGTVGYLLGTVFAKYVTPYVVSIPLSVAFDLPLGVMSVVITVVLTLIAGSIPIYRITELDPVEALRL